MATKEPGSSVAPSSSVGVRLCLQTMGLSSQEVAELRCDPELCDFKSVLPTTPRSLSSLSDEEETVSSMHFIFPFVNAIKRLTDDIYLHNYFL